MQQTSRFCRKNETKYPMSGYSHHTATANNAWYLLNRKRVHFFFKTIWWPIPLESMGADAVELLSSLLSEQVVRGSNPGVATWISDIDYILLTSCDMAKSDVNSLEPTRPTLKLDWSLVTLLVLSGSLKSFIIPLLIFLYIKVNC